MCIQLARVLVTWFRTFNEKDGRNRWARSRYFEEFLWHGYFNVWFREKPCVSFTSNGIFPSGGNPLFELISLLVSFCHGNSSAKNGLSVFVFLCALYSHPIFHVVYKAYNKTMFTCTWCVSLNKSNFLRKIPVFKNFLKNDWFVRQQMAKQRRKDSW